MIDRFRRYQSGLTLQELYPTQKPLCSCGCQTILPARRSRWASDECSRAALTRFFIIKGDIRVIRRELEIRDKGACRECASITDDWQADHIVPVHLGGGGCELSGFQTLCRECHREKTDIEMEKLRTNHELLQ